MKVSRIYLLPILLLFTACSGDQQKTYNQKMVYYETTGPEADVNIPDTVYFTIRHSFLTHNDFAILARHAKWLKTYESVKVIVEGHANDGKNEKDNIQLGKWRAESVKRYYMEWGVDPNRIKTVGVGSKKPPLAGQTGAISNHSDRRTVTIVDQ